MVFKAKMILLNWAPGRHYSLDTLSAFRALITSLDSIVLPAALRVAPCSPKLDRLKVALARFPYRDRQKRVPRLREMRPPWQEEARTRESRNLETLI